MKRLKELLHQKIERVQLAEQNQTWSIRTIQTETEFLLLVKQLIEENETLKFEQTPPPPQPLESEMLFKLLLEFWGLLNQYQYVGIECEIELFERYNELPNYKARYMAKHFLESYIRQELKTSPKPQKEFYELKLKSLPNVKEN